PRTPHTSLFPYTTLFRSELALVGSISSDIEVGSLSVGYVRRVGRLREVGAWLGARGHVDIVPEQLRLFYGSRTPAGVLVYLGVRSEEHTSELQSRVELVC